MSAPEPLVPTGTEAHADEIEPSGTEQDAPEQAETEQAETSDDSGQPFPRGLGAFAVDAAPLGASSAPLSFDEIVFGTAEPSATDEDDSDASGRIDAAAAVSAPDHTVEADDDATRVLPVVAVTGEDDEEPTEDEPLTEESLANESLSEEPLADESVADEGPADEPLSDEGIEIFAALQEDDASAPEADDDSPEASPSGSDDASDSGASDEEDPRSASVSSMLAAAARAYFDEEPKDYPLQRQDETESAPSPWVAASTGAGETVPPASEDDQATDASGNSSDRDGDDSPEHGHDSHEHGDGHHRD